MRHLRVAKNRLAMLPEALLSDLPFLELLDAGDNQLRSLPRLLSGGALKTLLAPRNRLRSTPEWPEPSRLETLVLTDNAELAEIPKAPKSLTALDVENCGLSALDVPNDLKTHRIAEREMVYLCVCDRPHCERITPAQSNARRSLRKDFGQSPTELGRDRDRFGVTGVGLRVVASARTCYLRAGWPRRATR